jgi:hypothetical protein
MSRTNSAPFLKHTGLSEKRFSRQFALAQICLNSFKRKGDDFVRARFNDLEDFFREQASLSLDDPNFIRIRRVLKIMDRDFASPQGTPRAIPAKALATLLSLPAAVRRRSWSFRSTPAAFVCAGVCRQIFRIRKQRTPHGLGEKRGLVQIQPLHPI